MRRLAGMEVQRRKRFHQRAQGELHGNDLTDQSESSGEGDVEDGEEAWRNSEGERLRDFGVDEEIEFYDEEDIPLGVLMRQRAERQR
jgi:palmitoyltransferase